jgi:hypothetical protein
MIFFRAMNGIRNRRIKQSHKPWDDAFATLPIMAVTFQWILDMQGRKMDRRVNQDRTPCADVGRGLNSLDTVPNQKKFAIRSKTTITVLTFYDGILLSSLHHALPPILAFFASLQDCCFFHAQAQN